MESHCTIVITGNSIQLFGIFFKIVFYCGKSASSLASKKFESFEHYFVFNFTGLHSDTNTKLVYPILTMINKFICYSARSWAADTKFC